MFGPWRRTKWGYFENPWLRTEGNIIQRDTIQGAFKNSCNQVNKMILVSNSEKMWLCPFLLQEETSISQTYYPPSSRLCTGKDEQEIERETCYSPNWSLQSAATIAYPVWNKEIGPKADILVPILILFFSQRLSALVCSERLSTSWRYWFLLTTEPSYFFSHKWIPHPKKRPTL